MNLLGLVNGGLRFVSGTENIDFFGMRNFHYRSSYVQDLPGKIPNFLRLRQDPTQQIETEASSARGQFR